MGDEREKIIQNGVELQPAEESPWYRLATLYGNNPNQLNADMWNFWIIFLGSPYSIQFDAQMRDSNNGVLDSLIEQNLSSPSRHLFNKINKKLSIINKNKTAKDNYFNDYIQQLGNKIFEIKFILNM